MTSLMTSLIISFARVGHLDGLELMPHAALTLVGALVQRAASKNAPRPGHLVPISEILPVAVQSTSRKLASEPPPLFVVLRNLPQPLGSKNGIPAGSPWRPFLEAVESEMRRRLTPRIASFKSASSTCKMELLKGTP